MKPTMTTIIALFSMALLHVPIQASSLSVSFRGMDHPKGDIRVALYNKADGFLGDKAYRNSNTKIAADLSAFLTFSKLPEGEYAIVAYQDVNGNERLDSNFIGMPIEPTFISNNARGSFGPPTFEDAKFILGKRHQSLLLQQQ
jgi:uncharacterized protein (DUF2141 family)